MPTGFRAVAPRLAVPRQQVGRAAFPRLRPGPEPTHGWLNGSCVLLRTSALQQVGLFDEASSSSSRTRTSVCASQRGRGLEACADASIVHLGHQTILSSELRPEIEEQLLRSRYLFFRKHHGPTVARAVTLLVRCALLMRASKMLAEAAAGRRPTGFSRARTLWELTRSRPTRPSKLELRTVHSPH